MVSADASGDLFTQTEDALQKILVQFKRFAASDTSFKTKTLELRSHFLEGVQQVEQAQLTQAIQRLGCAAITKHYRAVGQIIVEMEEACPGQLEAEKAASLLLKLEKSAVQLKYPPRDRLRTLTSIMGTCDSPRLLGNILQAANLILQKQFTLFMTKGTESGAPVATLLDYAGVLAEKVLDCAEALHAIHADPGRAELGEVTCLALHTLLHCVCVWAQSDMMKKGEGGIVAGESRQVAANTSSWIDWLISQLQNRPSTAQIRLKYLATIAELSLAARKFTHVREHQANQPEEVYKRMQRKAPQHDRILWIQQIMTGGIQAYQEGNALDDVNLVKSLLVILQFVNQVFPEWSACNERWSANMACRLAQPVKLLCSVSSKARAALKEQFEVFLSRAHQILDRLYWGYLNMLLTPSLHPDQRALVRDVELKFLIELLNDHADSPPTDPRVAELYFMGITIALQILSSEALVELSAADGHYCQHSDYFEVPSGLPEFIMEHTKGRFVAVFLSIFKGIRLFKTASGQFGLDLKREHFTSLWQAWHMRLVVVELLDQTQVVQGLTFLNEEASFLLAAYIPRNDVMTQAILYSATSIWLVNAMEAFGDSAASSHPKGNDMPAVRRALSNLQVLADKVEDFASWSRSVADLTGNVELKEILMQRHKRVLRMKDLIARVIKNLTTPRKLKEPQLNGGAKAVVYLNGTKALQANGAAYPPQGELQTRGLHSSRRK